ncbi:MAG: TIGR00304 family membrane protein [Candidatus Bathyarchaeota archaeon]
MLKMMSSPEAFTLLGFILVFTGILIVAVAMLLAVFTSLGKGRVEGAGVVLLGPIPIVFGSNIKIMKTLVLMFVFLVILLAIFVLLPAFFTVVG